MVHIKKLTAKFLKHILLDKVMMLLVIILTSSSMVERSFVKRVVGGSSPL